MKTSFSAPKSMLLKLVTALAPLVATCAFLTEKSIYGFALIFVLGICALFWVVEYRVTDGELRINYPGRYTVWNLTGLRKIEVMSDDMGFTFRLFGTGLFSMVGLYYSSRIGWYRSYATDSKLSVVLYFPRNVVVVTPDDPEEFAQTVRGISKKT